jgi:outer membrane lipoprotein SlyB
MEARMGRAAGLGAPLLALLATACVVVPPGPSPAALTYPAPGKTFEVFQQEDYVCRQFAAAQTSNVSSVQAANQSFASSASAGTLVGAAAGAAIGFAAGGPAVGAAIGAASGLLLGTAAGATAASYSGVVVQQRYDAGYLQCMSAKGENVPVGSSAAYPYLYPYSYLYPYAYPSQYSALYPYSGPYMVYHSRYY